MMQRIKALIGLPVATAVAPRLPKKHDDNGHSVKILSTEDKTRKRCLIEHQGVKEPTCHSPALRERIITALHLSKRGIETPNDACQISTEKFMFGEEFEYWPPEVTGRNSWQVVSDLLNSWEQGVRERIRELGIPDSEFSIKRKELSEEHEMLGGCDQIDVKIGNWHCRGFRDSWCGNGLLEFNTSPYRIDQTFQVNGKTYTPYELFDCFIFSICKNMNLEPSSGHKRVDFSESVGGNTEFLFRLLVDVEDKAWLCSAFGMELYSSTSTTFVTQREDADKRMQGLKTIISLYNELLAEGYIHEREDFYTSLHKIREFWEFVTGSNERYVPVHLPEPERGVNNAKAKKGEIVSNPRDLTAEFRCFNTPRDGNETRKLNIFLLEWLTQINKKQIDRASVEYTSYNPEKPQSKEKTLQMMEQFCNQELKLSASHHKQILRV